ncbi:hypothetical protein BBJ29_007343 [Phytophthora kernoviae]|uniref:diacylglycerol O-acyltransferase n=1 Tax=Phytophthora kernoviae TaxID=325452 RepID=A0A3F2RXE1_9STRA|nr:hypothetical protein BBJ29_007343 [Phytophthora kernoviae]RLN65610.1 hypothetical protein BBP00_00002728 [Phytophthora kernoviae]
MATGQNVCLIPGGFEEATLYERGKHRNYTIKRFGFIKLALQYGYKHRLRLNEFKIPGVLFYGLPQCFYLSCTNVDLITVIGKPLALPRIENPTKEDAQKYHSQYVQVLHNLFDKSAKANVYS